MYFNTKQHAERHMELCIKKGLVGYDAYVEYDPVEGWYIVESYFEADLIPDGEADYDAFVNDDGYVQYYDVRG